MQDSAVNSSTIGDINVELTGEGVAPLLVIQAEKSINFGNQTRGTISKPQRVSIANEGSGDLTIVSAHVSGKRRL